MADYTDAPLDMSSTAGVPYASWPVPGLAHGAIPGLLGVAMNGESPLSYNPPAKEEPSRLPKFRSIVDESLTNPEVIRNALLAKHRRPPNFAERFGDVTPLTEATVEGAQFKVPPQQAPWPQPPAPTLPPAEVKPEQQMPVSLAPPPAGDPAGPVPAPAPTQAAGLPGVLGNFLQNAGNWRDANKLPLLALGASFLGHGLRSPGAFNNIVPAMVQQTTLNQQNETAQALMKRMPGLSAADAQVAAQNPEILKQILPRMFGAKQWTLHDYTDAFGQKHPILVDQVSGETMRVDLSGRGNQPPAAPGGMSTGTPGVSGGAPGVSGGGVQPPSARMTLDNFDMSRVDPNVRGWDYLKQFPEEVEAATRAYMSGGVMPTGNPRMQGITTMAKTAAQKVANDLGNPDLADDTLYAARRQLRTDLERSAPNSLGGILDNGISAFKHLGEYSDALVDLKNYSGPNVPFGGHIGTAGNWISNVAAPSPQTKAKIAAANDAAGKYGAEATKFYAGTGGGVEERRQALEDNNAKTKTGAEQAAFLEMEKRLMLDRLQQKEDHIRRTLGEEYLRKHPVRPPGFDQVIAKIDANIARLRGQGGPAEGRPPANAGEALAQARAAIARGAPRDAVAARLRQAGIDPSGL